MADINVYKQQANQIYDPLLQTETQQAGLKRDTALASLDSEQRTVEPAYQTAVANLDEQTRGNEARINQLYNSRLQGNFSGLQANDAGMMYGRAATARSTIETTRANKLADIAAKRGLAEQTYQGEVGAATTKNASSKSQYAMGAYNQAVQAEAKNKATVQAAAIRAANATQKQTAKDYSVGYKIDKTTGKNYGYMFTGPNQAPISMYQYAQATGNSMLDLLKQSPTEYDRNAYNDAMSMANQGANEDQILSTLAKKYSLLF